MNFIKRDFVLLGATAMIVLAAWIYLDLMYALGIGVGIFFGLKAVAAGRQASINRQIGEGLCARCGQKVLKGACPDCDSDREEQ